MTQQHFPRQTGQIHPLNLVSVPVPCLSITGWGWSGWPSSGTPASNSAAVRFSSPTEKERLGPWQGCCLTEWLWRRTPLCRSSSLSGWLWAVCTCTLHRGRCRGSSPRNQLQRQEKRLHYYSRWAKMQMLPHFIRSRHCSCILFVLY